MRILVDGSALSLSVVNDADSAAWREWLSEHSDAVDVTEIAVTQMRLRAKAIGPDGADGAYDLAWAYPIRRFSDQSLEFAGRISRALEPFVALQVALAYRDPELGAIATYDPTMAAAAELIGVPVISPGRTNSWWHLPDAERSVRVREVPGAQGEPEWVELAREARESEQRAAMELERVRAESVTERAALDAALAAIHEESRVYLAQAQARAAARAGVLSAPAFAVKEKPRLEITAGRQLLIEAVSNAPQDLASPGDPKFTEMRSEPDAVTAEIPTIIVPDRGMRTEQI